MNLNTRPSRQVDPAKHPHVGYKYTKDGRLYGDKRCPICGVWFTWVDIEPEHCFEASVKRILSNNANPSGCRDWVEIRERYMEQKGLEDFLRLKEAGLVS